VVSSFLAQRLPLILPSGLFSFHFTNLCPPLFLFFAILWPLGSPIRHRFLHICYRRVPCAPMFAHPRFYIFLMRPSFSPLRVWLHSSLLPEFLAIFHGRSWVFCRLPIFQSLAFPVFFVDIVYIPAFSCAFSSLCFTTFESHPPPPPPTSGMVFFGKFFTPPGIRLVSPYSYLSGDLCTGISPFLFFSPPFSGSPGLFFFMFYPSLFFLNLAFQILLNDSPFFYLDRPSSHRLVLPSTFQSSRNVGYCPGTPPLQTRFS